MTRVAVFIDYQNAYRGARSAFNLDSAEFVEGQFFPGRLGLHVVQEGRSLDPERQLVSVAVYRGEPSSLFSPKGLAACQRQARLWSTQPLVTPVTRPLKYYGQYTDVDGRRRYTDVREKGIDVLIALGIVMGAMRDEYDVAVLMSADSDLLPALETARELGKRVEVAAWRSRSWSSQLRLPGMWCHNLDESWYRRLHDPTDYTQPILGET